MSNTIQSTHISPEYQSPSKVSTQSSVYNNRTISSPPTEKTNFEKVLNFIKKNFSSFHSFTTKLWSKKPNFQKTNSNYLTKTTNKTASLQHKLKNPTSDSKKMQTPMEAAFFQRNILQNSSTRRTTLKEIDAPLSKPSDNFEKISPETIKLLKERGINNKTISKITSWHSKNWSKVATAEGAALPIIQGKVSYLQGVKYVKDSASGKISIQIAGKEIGSGSYKRVKSGIQILSNGLIQDTVRFTQTKSATSALNFKSDINKELHWRSHMKKSGESIPDTITHIKTYTYTSKTGELKTRYVGEKCEGEVFKLMYGKNMVYNKNLDKKRVLTCYKDALNGLAFLHKQGIVHLDMKPENILFNKGKGKLNDFGLAESAYQQLNSARGTPGYIDPALFTPFPIVTPKNDMFSVGIMLLEVADNKNFLNFQQAQDTFLDSKGKQNPQNNVLKEIRASLLKNPTNLNKLIFELLDPNPSNRPNSEETEKRLNTIILETAVENGR